MSIKRFTGVTVHMGINGRICLPIELRRSKGLVEGETLGLYVDDEGDIILRKGPEASCVFCEGTAGLEDFHGSPVCSSCLAEIRGQLIVAGDGAPA